MIIRKISSTKFAKIQNMLSALNNSIPALCGDFLCLFKINLIAITSLNAKF